MAKRYKNNELRRAFLGNVFTTAKDRTTGAIFLGIIAAGASILLSALKNDQTADEEEIFRE